MRFLLVLIVLLAALSPLFTFARLFQIKEWRWDRLREHLRHEGCCGQLFGWVKPLVIVLGFITFFVMRLFESTAEQSQYALWIALAVLAWFTLFRFVIGRQVRPVWTKKSIAVVGLALFFFVALSFGLSLFHEQIIVLSILTLLSLFSFAFVGLALIILTPLDAFLKLRILDRARDVRAKLPNLAVIGVTGSVGKTTTKELLSHILHDRKILVTPAHVNTELGVAALMIRKLTKEHQIFIVEMGAYRRGEIRVLSSIVKPQIGIITFIGKQHLGLFGSMEDLCRAKGELFESLPQEGHAFLNADPVQCEELMKLTKCPVHTVGTGGHATFEAFDIQETPNGVSFTLRGTQFSVPLQGTHQVTNILLAASVSEALGVPLAESAKRLLTFQGPSQTFERKEGKQGQTVLDDTHNASPESFRAAIEWARTSGCKRKILVAAGLLELGPGEQGIHQELGLQSRGIFDEVIFLSKKCARYFELGYGKTVRVFPKKKFKIAVKDEMLIVCEGRMPSTIVEKLLS
jgi:UDP-N-acetylmuramyl pentapeptide synthase